MSSSRVEWIVGQIRRTEADLASTLAAGVEATEAGQNADALRVKAEHLAVYLGALHEELAALQFGADTTIHRQRTATAKADVDRDSGKRSNGWMWVGGALLVSGVVGTAIMIRRRK